MARLVFLIAALGVTGCMASAPPMMPVEENIDPGETPNRVQPVRVRAEDLRRSGLRPKAATLRLPRQAVR